MIHAQAKSGWARGETQNERRNGPISNGSRRAGSRAMSRLSRQYGSDSTTSTTAIVR